MHSQQNIKFPKDDLKKIQTCWNISGLYVKVYVLLLVHLSVLSVKLFFNEQI